MHDFAGQYYVCAIFLCVLAHFVYVKRNRRMGIQQKCFLLLVTSEFFSALGGFLSELFVVPAAENIFLAELFTYVYFVAHTVSPLVFCFYTMVLAGLDKKYPAAFFASFSLPSLLCLFLIAQNVFTHDLFYFAGAAYTRGSLMALFYVANSFSLLVSFYIILRYRSVIPNSTMAVLLTFMLSVFLSVVIQLVIKKLLVEVFMQALCTLFILVTIEDSGEIYNEITGVYNRRTFLKESLRSLENNVIYKIIVLKITNARFYTKIFGFRFIQEIMQEIAQWLCAIANCTWVYDCDNNNFAIILYKKDQGRSKEIVDSIYKKFAENWISHGVSISFEVQICMVLVPHDINSIESLIALLDTNDFKAEYRISVIREDQLRLMQRRSTIEEALSNAIAENALKVYFQPIWDCKTNKIVSAESLVRLIDGDLGSIPPDEFIPIAEKNGTITRIGQFAFEETCALFSRARLASLGIEFLEVNLSSVQCMHPNLADVFYSTLMHYNLTSKEITLEIKESAVSSNQDIFMQTIKDLRSLKFDIALDNYGTDEGNKFFIFKMDFDIIKLNRKFLWDSEKDPSLRSALGNIIHMLKDLGLRVIVEGVETREQRDMAVAMGADYCQGYFFSRPIPPQEFIQYVRQFNSHTPS